MPQQPSWRHHYLPEFYLQRWTSARDSTGTRKLVEFSKPYGNTVRPRFVTPKATGFLDSRRELEGLLPEHAQAMENTFFKPVDTKASTVLGKMEAGVLEFTDAEKSAWAQFLMSLVLRHPENLRGMLANLGP